MFADDIKSVKVEVLEDGGGEEEHGVLLQERERHVRPAEVVVLAVEVTLSCASLAVVRDDVAFCAVPVVGDNAAVYVFRTEDAFRFRVGTFIGDWRTLDHESQTHFRKHAVELEGRDAALLTPYVCFCPVRMFHNLGIS